MYLYQSMLPSPNPSPIPITPFSPLPKILSNNTSLMGGGAHASTLSSSSLAEVAEHAALPPRRLDKHVALHPRRRHARAALPPGWWHSCVALPPRRRSWQVGPHTYSSSERTSEISIATSSSLLSLHSHHHRLIFSLHLSMCMLLPPGLVLDLHQTTH